MIGLGECRLSIEAGNTVYPVLAQISGKPVNAETLLEVLPRLTRALQASLERAQEREARQ